MRPVRFSPAIEHDLDQAVAWLDRQQRGLGDRFLREFRAAVGRVARFGYVLRPVHGSFRRIRFESFEYHLFFRPDGDGFYVSLVIAAMRDPARIESLLKTRE